MAGATNRAAGSPPKSKVEEPKDPDQEAKRQAEKESEQEKGDARRGAVAGTAETPPIRLGTPNKKVEGPQDLVHVILSMANIHNRS